jgi:hypothetical protein
MALPKCIVPLLVDEERDRREKSREVIQLHPRALFNIIRTKSTLNQFSYGFKLNNKEKKQKYFLETNQPLIRRIRAKRGKGFSVKITYRLKLIA